jgi:hypothetical protein
MFTEEYTLPLISVAGAGVTAAAFKVTDEPLQIVVSFEVMLAMQGIALLYN